MLSSMEKTKHLEPCFSQAFAEVFKTVNDRFRMTEAKINTTESEFKFSTLDEDFSTFKKTQFSSNLSQK